MASRVKFQRVMPLLLKEEKNKNDYIPKVVSIGPYHHRMPELAPVEAFKPLAVDLFVSDSRRNTDFYYSELLGIIGEIRGWYEEKSTVDYSDDQLTGLMLHDACFIINHMEIMTASDTAQFKWFTMRKHLGMLTLAIVRRDLFLLENQIPLRVIKLLIDLRYEAGEYENLLHRYLNSILFGENRHEGGIEKERGEPLHLLEAFHWLVISNFKKTGGGGFKCRRLCCFMVDQQQPHTLSDGVITAINSCFQRSKCFDIESGLLRTLGCKKAAKNPKNEKVIHSFRSVTDLKAKGIYFHPSPTKSLMDVGFKSHFFYATVQLPCWYVSFYTKMIILNLIAYELSPNSPAQGEVLSYIDFIKSLMERPADVKELRDKKILYNELGSDEEVLSVYKDINTATIYVDYPEVFGKLKDKIQAHYQSRTKTWMAELFHTYFRTPWTVIAFLAAISLLAISAAQLHYAVHPNS